MIKASVFGLSVIILVSGQLGVPENQRAVAQAGQKPVREEDLFVSYRKPPDTVAEMVSTATAVVVAEWTGQSRPVEEAVSGGGIPPPNVTAYNFRLLNIVKLDPLLPCVGGEIEFNVMGGEKESTTHVERTKNRSALDFMAHHRYVIFIGRDSRANKLYLRWGPLGVYDVTNRSVASLSPSWRRHNGTDANSFLSAVKSAAKK